MLRYDTYGVCRGIGCQGRGWLAVLSTVGHWSSCLLCVRRCCCCSSVCTRRLIVFYGHALRNYLLGVYVSQAVSTYLSSMLHHIFQIFYAS